MSEGQSSSMASSPNPNLRFGFKLHPAPVAMIRMDACCLGGSRITSQPLETFRAFWFSRVGQVFIIKLCFHKMVMSGYGGGYNALATPHGPVTCSLSTCPIKSWVFGSRAKKSWALYLYVHLSKLAYVFSTFLK